MKIFITYFLLTIWSSLYIAWHYAAAAEDYPHAAGAAVFIIMLVSFNAIWLMIASVRRKIRLTRHQNNILSLLLGFSFFLMLLFIANDMLFFFEEYAFWYFSRARTAVFTITAVAAGATFFAFANSYFVRVTRYNITPDKPALDFSVAMVSDLHIDESGMSARRMEKIICRINELKPDFAVFAGDIIESTPEHFIREDFPRIIKKLQTRFPPVAVIGNHEYYGGRIRENIEALQQAGLTVLRDEILNIPELGVSLLGRDDKMNRGRCALCDLKGKAPADFLTILLDHNPQYIDEAVDNGIDIQLSGHTHNGQIFPFNLIVRRIFANGYGYRKIGGTHTVVSSGAGTWGPSLRLGTKAEIAFIRVKSV